MPRPDHRERKQSRQNQTQSNLSPEFIVPSDESEYRKEQRVPRPDDREEERKTIETRPNTVQLLVGVQLIARFTRDESETRRNNECQDLTTGKRRENHQDQNQTQSNLSPEFIVPSDESEYEKEQ